MKFYSEKLKCIFDSVEELQTAEKKFDARNDSKKQMFAEIEKQLDESMDNMCMALEKLDKITDIATDEEMIAFVANIMRKLNTYITRLNLL